MRAHYVGLAWVHCVNGAGTLWIYMSALCQQSRDVMDLNERIVLVLQGYIVSTELASYG